MDKIQVPQEMPGDRVTVIVSGRINRRGRPSGFIVLKSKTGSGGEFEEAVQRALHVIRMKPAKVESRTKTVWTNFSVIFQRVEGEIKASVYPHMRVNAYPMDPSYHEPQRVLVGGFPNSCRKRGSVIWSAVTVDAAGEPSDPIVSGGNELCQKGIKRRLLASTYVPGEHDGVPIASKFFEIWFSS